MLTFKVGSQRFAITARGKAELRHILIAALAVAGFGAMQTIGRALAGEF